MRTEMLNSIIDYEMFIGNINESLFGIEKELMVKEHHSIIKNESEIFNEAVGEKVRQVAQVVMRAIIKFKDWVATQLRKFINFIGKTLSKAIEKLEKTIDNVVGNIEVEEDIAKSINAYTKFLVDCKSMAIEVKSLNFRDYESKEKYDIAMKPVDTSLRSLIERMETLRSTEKTKYGKQSIRGLREASNRIQQLLEVTKIISESFIKDSQKSVSILASTKGNEWKDKESVTFHMLKNCALQFNYISGSLTRVTSYIIGTSQNISTAIQKIAKKD
jgi:hypothetical protein